MKKKPLKSFYSKSIVMLAPAMQIVICSFAGAGAPKITSFSPLQGVPGSSVTITGTNFNNTAANNIVFFGATKATVTAASTTSLTVTVPLGAKYSAITVTNTSNHYTAFSPVLFLPTFAGGPAVVSSLSFPTTSKLDLITGTQAFAALSADLDNDGMPDLIVTNQVGTISIFRNTGIAGGLLSFAPKNDISISPSKPNFVALGDLDGDGLIDMVVQTPTEVSAFRNTTTGSTISFAAKVNLISATVYNAMVIGDFDGDGKPDVAVANQNNYVSVFRNTTTTTTLSFAAKVDFATGSYPVDLGMGDLDGDGKLDLATANYTANTISVLQNTATTPGTMSFAAKVDFATPAGPWTAAFGDIDGDGKMDLVSCNDANNASVLRNTHTSGNFTAGSFAAHLDFKTGTAPGYLAITDVDGDGKPDLMTSNSGSTTASVLSNTSTSGAVSFAANVEVQSGGAPYYVSGADMNGDGKPELLVTNSTSGNVSIEFNVPQYIPVISSFSPETGAAGTTVTISGLNFNTTAGNNIVFFGATQAMVTMASATSLTVIVPAGASKAPITVLNTGSVLSGYSPKPFLPNYPAAMGSWNFVPKTDLTTATAPKAVAIGDLDGDGKPDVVVANDGSASVSVFLNTGTSGAPAFNTKLDFTTASNPQSVAIADIDQDGKPDIVTLNYGSSGSISVLRNTSVSAGSITFSGKVDKSIGSNGLSMAINDVDLDGYPDVAIVSNNTNRIYVVRNTSSAGSVSWSSTSYFYNTAAGPYALAIGDIDGDGKPDLVCANYTVNSISVFRNTSGRGFMSFAGKSDFTVGLGMNPSAVVVGDLDGDGKQDVATANFTGNVVSVLRNTSSGPGILSFAAKVDLITGTNPRGLAIGDIDADGRLDLSTANSGSGNISIFHNATTGPGNIGFDAKVDFTGGTNPFAIVMNDIDGDGRPDLAFTNAGTNTASLLRNISAILPLKLLSFTGTRQQTAVLLKWSTANEISFNHFDVERSTNGKDFTKIATVSAATSRSSFYTCTDPSPDAVEVYYRLRMTDKDGTFSFSSVVTVRTQIITHMELSPNPASSILRVSLPQIAGISFTLKILNSYGQTVLSRNYTNDGTAMVLFLDINGLSSGSYFVHVARDDFKETKGFIKQ